MTTTLPRITDTRLESVADKVERGERLSAEDGLLLLTTHDLLTVGRLADTVRARLCGDAVFYNVNRHINATNICVAGCKFCAFARVKGEPPVHLEEVEVAGDRDGDVSGVADQKSRRRRG